MNQLTWRRDGDDWVASGVGTTAVMWRIERVWSDAPKGYGWYVTEPIDGGYFDSLPLAKSTCERETTKVLKSLESEIR